MTDKPMYATFRPDSVLVYLWSGKPTAKEGGGYHANNEATVIYTFTAHDFHQIFSGPILNPGECARVKYRGVARDHNSITASIVLEVE